MVGMTSTQTARLNIVQIPVDPGSPPSSPCAAVLNFYDSSSNLLNSKDVTSLSDGQTAYLDLNGNTLMSNNSAAFTNGRAEIRAEVVNLLDPLLPPDPSRCVVSLEVFDTATGATSVLWAHSPMPTLSTSSNDTQESAALDTKVSGNDTTTTITTMAAVTPSPKISVSPGAVNFGSAKVGSTSNPKTVTIKNTGNGDLTITSINISDTNYSDTEFIESSNCSKVPAKSSCAITVTFMSMSPFVKKTAIISILSNDPKKPTINVKLSGQAAPPKITISPTSVNFGSVAVGNTSAPKVITIKNTGISDLTLNAITFTGTNAAEFRPSYDCSTIAEGSSCAITVTFSPTSAGIASVQISIPSDDPKKPIINVTLTGKGTGGNTPPACTYTYSDWSACESNDTQTRTVVSSSPEGCVGTPVLSQPCTSRHQRASRVYRSASRQSLGADSSLSWNRNRESSLPLESYP